VVTGEMLRRLDAPLRGSENRQIGQSVALVRQTLSEMGITCMG